MNSVHKSDGYFTVIKCRICNGFQMAMQGCSLNSSVAKLTKYILLDIKGQRERIMWGLFQFTTTCYCPDTPSEQTVNRDKRK